MTCVRCGYQTRRCVHVYDLNRKLLRVEAPYDPEKRRQILFPKSAYNTPKRPEGDWLTSREYADVIGRDVSTVTNNAHKHGGVRVAGRWWFPPPKDVVEHACPTGSHDVPQRSCHLHHGCKSVEGVWTSARPTCVLGGRVSEKEQRHE